MIKRRAWWGTALLLAGGVVGLLSVATLPGLGLSRDSSVYFDAAWQLARARTFAVSLPGGGQLPLLHFPPLYPAALALVSALFPDLFSAARVLALALTGLNVVLFFRLLQRLCRDAWKPALGGTVVWALSLSTLQIHSMAWSEPLALSLALGGMLGLVSYDRTRGFWPLLAASLLFSLAVLARYAAISWWIALWIVLAPDLLRHSKSRSKRLASMLLGAAPVFFWSARNIWRAGSFSDRTLDRHPEALLAMLPSLWDTLALWFFPHDLLPAGRWIAPVIVAALFWMFPVSGNTLTRYLRSFAGVYLALLALTLCFFDPDTPLDTRILSPLHAVFWLWVIAQGHAWLAPSGRKRNRAVQLFLVFLAISVARAGHWAMSVRADAQGYASRRWRQSELLASLRERPPQARLFSNVPQAITLYTAQSAYMMPPPEEAAEMVAHIQSGDAVLALFETPGWPVDEVSRRLEERFGFICLRRADDGGLYGK